MFFLSTFNFDFLGIRGFRGSKNTYKIDGISRRVRQTKLLSGDIGSFITDSGSFDSDRKIYLTVENSPDNKEYLEYITKYYSFVRFSGKEGSFRVCPKGITLKEQNNKIELTLLIDERIS